jgi:rhamnulokinase
VVGGGSRNRLMCQATANAAGVPLVSFSLEGTAVGNIARQLIALGAVKSLSVFRELLGRRLERQTYQPRSK